MAQGKVTAVNVRDTAYGKMYTIDIAGTSYGVGKYPPKAAVGDYVEFNYTENGRYKNLDNKSLRKIAEPAGAAEAPLQPAPSRAAPSGGGNSRYMSDEAKTALEMKKQEVISRQAARNSALTFMSLLASQEALPIAASAKKDAKYDALLGILDEITERFYNYSMGTTASSNDKPSAHNEESPADDPWQD